MFGVIVASRPVIADPQTVNPNQFAFTIPSQPNFSHIVVFLLPGNTLAAGTAAGVHIQIPPAQDFRFLGAIANEKPSAIFKVNLKASPDATATGGGDDVMIDDTSAPNTQQTTGGPNIVLGVSVEPIANIETQLATLRTNKEQAASAGNELVRHQPQQQTVTTKVLAQRIIQNAFNFLSSFASGSSGHETVPLKAFHDWWSKFEKRIELDSSFLEKSDQS